MNTFNKKENWNATAIFNYCSFSRYNRQNTGGNLTFCTKWKHETGLVFVIYGVVKHIAEQDYYLNLRCTAQKTLSFFSVQKSVLIATICKIIYFMKSHHDKQYAKCFKHENNENNLRKEHTWQQLSRISKHKVNNLWITMLVWLTRPVSIQPRKKKWLQEYLVLYKISQ